MIQPSQLGTLNLAIGEPSKTFFGRHGNTMPAMVVPRKVMAMTSVASSVIVWNVKML